MDKAKELQKVHMKKLKVLKYLIGVWILTLGTPPSLWSDTRIGMEGVLEKRDNGDPVYVPQGWVDLSVSHFPSESFSLFGDFSAKGGWDSGMQDVPYDVSMSLSASLRGETFFTGIEAGLRAVKRFDTARQLEANLSSILSYTRGEGSLFLKPFAQAVWGPTDSATLGIEPGMETLWGDGWVWAVSFRPALTYFSDRTTEVSLEPKLTVDWFPSVPFTLNIRTGWKRRLSDDYKVTFESVLGSAGLVWYPKLHVIFQWDTAVERVYRASTSADKGLTLDSELELRMGLPSWGGSWDLILGGGYGRTLFSEDSQAEDRWYVKIGWEMRL